MFESEELTSCLYLPGMYLLLSMIVHYPYKSYQCRQIREIFTLAPSAKCSISWAEKD